MGTTLVAARGDRLLRQALLGDPQHLHGRALVVFQQLEQLPGDGSLQAPPDLPDALALSPPPGGVGAGGGVTAQPGHHDGV